MKQNIRKTSILAKIRLIAVLAAVSVSFTVFATAKAQEALLLTQTSAVLGLGQKITFIALNGSKLKVTRSNTAVRANVYGGNQVTIIGNRIGNAKVKVCDGNRCAEVAVKVQKAKDLRFSLGKTNIFPKVGEKISVTTKNGKNVTAYSNNEIAKAEIQGSNILVTGIKTGKATITVCSSNRGCIPIFVNVKPALKKVVKGIKITNEEPKALMLSETRLILEKNESRVVQAESNNLTATSNSNAVRTAINGNQVTFYGTEVGSANVKICDTRILCSTVHVKVNNSNVVFEVTPTNLTLETGKTGILKIKGGTSVKLYSNSKTFKAVQRESFIFINASTYTGKATLSVCNGDNCIPVEINVKAGEAPLKTSKGTMKTVALDLEQTTSFAIPRNEATSYYITKHSNPQVASVEVKDKTVIAKGLRAGTALVEICPLNPEFKCGTNAINVSRNYYCASSNGMTLSTYGVTVVRGSTAEISSSVCNGLISISDEEDIVRTAVNGGKVILYAGNPGETKVNICTVTSCASVGVKVE